MNIVLKAPFAGTLLSSLNKQEEGIVFTWGGRVLIVGDEIKPGSAEVIRKRSLPF